MNAHAFINVVIPFDARNSAEVNAVIKSLADPSQGNYPNRAAQRQLSQVRGLHYMSLTVAEPLCPAEVNANAYGTPPEPAGQNAHLLAEISSDVGAQALLTELVQYFDNQLQALLTAAGITKPNTELVAFLVKHSVTIGDTWGATLGQVFTGSPGMTVERIIGEKALATRLGMEIRNQRARKDLDWDKLPPPARLECLRDELWRDPVQNWKWAFVPEPAPLLGAPPDSARSIFNPQIWKVAGTLFHKLLWPLYVPLSLIVILAFAYAWYEDGLIVALMWAVCVAGAIAVVSGLALIVALGRLRQLEQTDSVDDQVVSKQYDEELLSVENFGQQNHLASISRLKGGLLRRLTLRIAFIVVGAGRFVSAPGFLGKNGVIHFARWMRLPGTDQLLFWSNYDGTWESYVADFIADAPAGVTGIWSNCVGFPRTRGLFGGGAADRDRLIRWARRQQHPTRFWYSAYRDLSAARIRINAAIRQGFASAQSFQGCEDWFALFGSAPRPAYTLETQEIPSLAFGGLSSLRHSASFVVALKDDDVKSCRKFIEALRTTVLYGEAPLGQRSALIVAMSAQGLKRLGIPADAIETFPPAFKEGMWTQQRARELGDAEENEPVNWKWGGPGQDADVLVMAYAREHRDFTDLERSVAQAISDHGHRCTFFQPLTLLQDRYAPNSCGLPPHEPFGFLDGVSQPVIRGAPRRSLQSAPNDLVEAGELILGYPDNLGVIAPTPSMPDIYDPTHMLPDADADPFRQRPEFSSYEGHGRRDLGMNGTFLVARQLRQNVKALDEWFGARAVPVLKQTLTAVVNGKDDVLRIGISAAEIPRSLTERASSSVRTAAEDPPVPPIQLVPPPLVLLPIVIPFEAILSQVKDFLVAKLVGRWKDGASLVRYNRPPGVPNDDPSRQPDNDFLLGAEDPCGLACPFGAHIRRANPRDTRFPGSAAEIAAVNRHRLLRVGRVYGELKGPKFKELDPDKEMGLFFMCLNGDIERQFEFVQKSWLLNPSIHGLENEIDPILGRGKCRGFTIPTTAGPVYFPALPDLTTMIGGGYFFIPGKALLTFLSTTDPSPATSARARTTGGQA